MTELPKWIIKIDELTENIENGSLFNHSPLQTRDCRLLLNSLSIAWEALSGADEMAEYLVRRNQIEKLKHYGDCTKEAHTCQVCLAEKREPDIKDAMRRIAELGDGK